MISRWHSRWRRARSLFSRSEWASRLLKLPRFADDGAPGLVMIQIDGFSHLELQRALKKKEMPFLARLLKREHYEARRLYSGLPSNTPAMQGELFYGVPGAVPAFGFFNRECGRLCKMFEGDMARRVEAELASKGEPLLKGGTSYSNIYTGGASEARWCFASLGWGNSTKAPGPALLVLLALLHAYGFARAAAYGFAELGVAFWDAVKGIRRGEQAGEELKFIFSRMCVCILLREWITEAAKMDVARGMPIVHLNFVGYDEQAHRRGPDSAFAHWTLKGIDDSIKRVWRAAKVSRRRQYEVWVYSDHGQIHSYPYRRTTGRSLGEAVWDYWHGDPAPEDKKEGDAAMLRARLLGGRKLQRLFPAEKPAAGAPAFPIVADFGPLALVYLGEHDPARRAALARRLVEEGQVPMALESSSEPLRGWTKEGEFILHRDAESLLGNHPFREQVLEDLERLRKHADAGDLALFGWKHGIERPVTFALENGSHGGISPEECSAFVVLPRYLERELLPLGGLRPVDLHRAAMVFTGRQPSPAIVHKAVHDQAPASHAARPELRVMTYNVHSCIGLDRRHDPRRIAGVIAHYHPDVVALQELEAGHPRTGGLHQAKRIAELLQYEYHFHAVRELDDEQFGNAILSRYPMRLLRAGGLPSLAGRRGAEQRGGLWVEVDVDGFPVQVLNTHLGLWPRERIAQARALWGDRWLGSRPAKTPLVICGDLNCGPRSPAYRALKRDLVDCQLASPKRRPANTWFTRLPLARLDHILVSAPLAVRQVQVPSFNLAMMASDHFPVVADIILRPEERGGPHVA
ncbi:MAG TPA: endonuclease/exonuclease/phosphatase family protein [Fibrobacteria bacterium]|nr:endonuclease/exonuclease/phosphatase family protein [Fibrobacteria bacterium]